MRKIKIRYNEINIVDCETGEVLSKTSWTGSVQQDTISEKRFKSNFALFLSQVQTTDSNICISMLSKQIEDVIQGNKQLELF